ncbi:hypothetical protein L596_025330 [Steinernema carpocapsae]|uniref:Uncharacterized protein n=1 Tax=Steinernema carpocapsae TaxID=34508 RepID=A0A4U5M8B4_STECR|nr:hypothetical protein L596_025330 [Steinernema carpocapsae]
MLPAENVISSFTKHLHPCPFHKLGNMKWDGQYGTPSMAFPRICSRCFTKRGTRLGGGTAHTRTPCHAEAKASMPSEPKSA